MNKDITLNLLSDFGAEYEKDKLAKVVRHAINSQDLQAAAKVVDETKLLEDRFSVDIKTMPVANQRQSGRCWIFAGLNVLREEVSKKLNLEKFELSQNYVAFYDKLEKINYFMESVIELKDKDFSDRTLSFILQNAIGDGGQWDMFVSIIKKYGVVPQDAMPETYQSEHTGTMNKYLNRRLRKFAVEIKKAESLEAVYELKNACLKELYSYLCSCFGVPPKSFDFEYVDSKKEYHYEKNLTAKEFYDKFVGVDLDEYVSIINAPTSDKPFHHMFTVKFLGNVVGKEVAYLNLPLEEFKEAVIKQLSAKEVVWFGSDCGNYGDRKGGYWDNQSFDVNDMFEIDFDITKEDGLNSGDGAMNHAMVLTGVNLVDEKATKWKIENSWGEDIAHKGYFVASNAWFDRYVYQAVVNKKYLSKEAVELLGSKKIELEPWDPMGSLAD